MHLPPSNSIILILLNKNTRINIINDNINDIDMIDILDTNIVVAS